MRHCFNSFNVNLLMPRPPSLHKNINKQQKITFYTVVKSHKLFTCEAFYYWSNICLLKVSCSKKLLVRRSKLVLYQHLNLPRPSANANATNNRSKSAIKNVKSMHSYKNKFPNFHHQVDTFHLNNSSNILKSCTK